MNEDIKILERFLKSCDEDLDTEICIKTNGLIKNSIENIVKAYKQKDKDNKDLRRLYRRTAEKLTENGKEELADYFLAQINEVPTFTINDDIDYYTEYYKFINGEIFSVKQLEYIEENQKKYFINKKTVKEKIEKKDKIIDLMAEEILYENNCSGKLDFEIYKDKEEVIKDFEKKVEENK